MKDFLCLVPRQSFSRKGGLFFHGKWGLVSLWLHRKIFRPPPPNSPQTPSSPLAPPSGIFKKHPIHPPTPSLARPLYREKRPLFDENAFGAPFVGFGLAETPRPRGRARRRRPHVCSMQCFRNAPSTAGNSTTGSERPSPEPLLKKEASPAVLGGREFWIHALEAFKCLELQGLGHPSRTLEGNSRKRSESVSGEFFRNFLRKVPAVLGVQPNPEDHVPTN